MQVTTIDFSRSFLTFRIDTKKKPPQTVSHKPPYSLNNARIQVECRLSVVEKQANQKQTFVLGANCKTERVGVDANIWTEPNADFVPIFSADEFMNIKTFASADMEVDLYPPERGKQPSRQTGTIADTFDDVRLDVVECQGQALKSAEEIVAATLANQPLVARTEFETDRYRAVIEYPVKTMNANERDMVYQTDTGPVLLPDLSVPPTAQLGRLELAFAAFNCDSWIELLVRAPTRIANGVDVFHYSRPIRLDARNQIIRHTS